jgi:hypothetical protein
MCEQQQPARLTEERDWIFKGFRAVEAPVELAKNFSIIEQQPLRAPPLIDHRKSAVGRCGRCVEPVHIGDRRGAFPTVKRECAAAAHPIDEFVTAPTERADASCRKAVLREESHDAS